MFPTDKYYFYCLTTASGLLARLVTPQNRIYSFYHFLVFLSMFMLAKTVVVQYMVSLREEGEDFTVSTMASIRC